MAHEHEEDFDQSWCKELLNSADYKRWPVPSRFNTSSRHSRTSNAMFGETLATPNHIRACLCLHREGKTAFDAETIFLLSLGSAMDGHNGMLHGGMICVLLDEIQGFAAGMIYGRQIFTGEAKIRYKNAVRTPSLILARSSVTKEEGRKIWTKATLEDGGGNVLSEGENVFIKRKEKL